MRNRKKRNKKNREFTRITWAFVILFLLLMAYIVYYNMVKAKDIVSSPYNARQNAFEDQVVRGTIYDHFGNVLAETKGPDEKRVYPYGEIFAQTVGYNSNGRSGLEAKLNPYLLTSNAFILERMKNDFRDDKNAGDSVVTTLDAGLQEVAYKALGNQKGAVFIMDATTGKIRVAVSKPSYDPNTLLENWSTLNSDSENSPLLNRAFQGLYPPGSTFKIVTTLEYLRETGDAYTYDCKSVINYKNLSIHCAGNVAHGHEDLKACFYNSCNCGFCHMALGLKRTAYRATAEGLLFNKDLPLALPYSKSRFQINRDSSDGELMMTAMGQGKTLVSPYHMGLIVDAVANNGQLMTPYFVEKIENNRGDEIKTQLPKVYKELLTAEEAGKLKTYMRSVVTDGTAKSLNSDLYEAAGKTGTAEYSSDTSRVHSWFTGFTNMEHPDLVVSCIVEEADQSGVTATGVVKQILDYYYTR